MKVVTFIHTKGLFVQLDAQCEEHLNRGQLKERLTVSFISFINVHVLF